MVPNIDTMRYPNPEHYIWLGDSDTSEFGSSCGSHEPSPEPDFGEDQVGPGGVRFSTSPLEAEKEEAASGIVGTITATALVAGARRTKFPPQGRGTGAPEPGHREPQQHTASFDPTAVYKRQHGTSSRKKQQKRGRKPRATQRVQKPRISANGRQRYEILCFREIRQRSNGLLEYEVSTPTWLTSKDLQGKHVLEEAEELVVKEFGRATWENEMSRRWYPNMGTETE